MEILGSRKERDANCRKRRQIIRRYEISADAIDGHANRLP